MDDYEPYESIPYEDDLMAFRERELDADADAGEFDFNQPGFYEFCDECSTGMFEGDGIYVDWFPFAVVYKDEGDSGVLCECCFKDFHGRYCDTCGDAIFPENAWVTDEGQSICLPCEDQEHR